MSKRGRIADAEIFETFASLLRQSASRVVERFKLHRTNAAANTLENQGFNFPLRTGGASVGSSFPQSSGRRASIAATTTKPIDILVIQYCMYYLDLSRAPPNHYTRLAQEVLTSSSDRIVMSHLFKKVPLPTLCEGLMAEYPADAIQLALKEVDEYVEVRAILADWIDEHVNDEELNNADAFIPSPDVMNSKNVRREELSSDDEAGSGAFSEVAGYHMPHNAEQGLVPLSTLGLASLLHRSLEFWVRVEIFMNAASLSSAKAHAFVLHPRYESDLMQLLRGLILSSSKSDAASPENGTSTTVRSDPSFLSANKDTASKRATARLDPERSLQEAADHDVVGIIPDRRSFVYESLDTAAEAEDVHNATLETGVDGTFESASARPGADEVYAQNVAATVLADSLALAHCPLPGPDVGSTPASSETVLSVHASQGVKGVNAFFYTMIHARLSFMVARDRLQLFGSTMATKPPPLTMSQQSLYDQHQKLQEQMVVGGKRQEDASLGVPLEYIPDDNYFRSLLERHHEAPMDEDEEIYKDEVVDYYLRHPWPQQTTRSTAPPAATSTTTRGTPRRDQKRQEASHIPANLVKPHRFCKVKTGFTWTQYNRTHYDARTNPPPRTVLWYEFTLFYPALVNTKRDMRNIFHIENTPKGLDDDYCLLVFSVGPPYADVAYRIVRKQWDTRRGGVRISFDSTGRYKLFFRFTNSNYRR